MDQTGIAAHWLTRRLRLFGLALAADFAGALAAFFTAAGFAALGVLGALATLGVCGALGFALAWVAAGLAAGFVVPPDFTAFGLD